MKISITVHPGSKQEKIKKIRNNEYEIWTTQKAIEGKANISIISILSDHLNISKSNIRLIKGLKSRKKLFEVFYNVTIK